MKDLLCIIGRLCCSKRWWGFLVLGIAVVLLSVWVIADDAYSRFGSKSHLTSDFTQPAMTLSRLCSMGAGELRHVEMGLMNLTCAADLHGSERVDSHGRLAELDRMAQRVKTETERHVQKFQDKPQEFNASEAYFRMLCLVTVLQQDFGVGYSPNRAKPSEGAIEPNETFFADSGDIFLHGLLGPKRTGTCASLPVLYIAVGRRLGYPLKLVATRNHLFVRWDSERETLNIEATTQGLTTFDDDYYRRWPFPMTPEEEQTERYLSSLNPAEELSVFFSLRTQMPARVRAIQGGAGQPGTGLPTDTVFRHSARSLGTRAQSGEIVGSKKPKPSRTSHRPMLLLAFLALAILPASAFYNPSTGKWLNRDPIEEKGGINLSAFDGNDLIAGINVLGLAELSKEQGSASLKDAQAALEAACAKGCNKLCDGCTVRKCKKEAAALAQRLSDAWNRNYGLGKAVGVPDNVGCFMCWDWAFIFEDAATSVPTRCLTYDIKIATAPVELVWNPETGRFAPFERVHFWLEVYPCKQKSSEIRVAIDDGIADGSTYHEGEFPPPESIYREPKIHTWPAQLPRHMSPFIPAPRTR